MLTALQVVLQIVGICLYVPTGLVAMGSVLYLLAILGDMFKDGVPKHAGRFGFTLLLITVMLALCCLGIWFVKVSGMPLTSPDGDYNMPPG